MRKVFTALVCLMLCFIASFSVGCKGNTPGTNDEQATVTTVTIGSKPVGTMEVGATCTLTVSVAPAGADGYELVWTSSDESVVSVENGTLTALKAGTAMITVTVKGTDVKDSFAVAVTEPEVKNPATSIAIGGKPEGVVRKGDKFTLTAILIGEDPDTACTDSVVWTSSDESVLGIDFQGNAVTKKTGIATVKAAVTGKQDELSDEFEVKVYPAASENGVYADNLANAEIGGAKGSLTKATVDGELLHGGTKYPTVAYAADEDGKLLISGDDVRNYDRTFLEPKFDDILSDGTYTVRISATLVSASVPSVADAQWTLYWWSKDRATDPIFAEKENRKAIVDMAQDGSVSGTFDGVGSDIVLSLNTTKALRGIAFGTFQSSVGNGSYVIRINEITFTPFVKVEDFSISNKSDVSEIRTDDTEKKIAYDYTNKTGEGAATAFTVKYESSDTDVLTVDENGNITPHKAGTAVVRAYVEGQEADSSDSVSITVKHVAVESILVTRDGATVSDSLREDIKGKTLPYTFALGYTVTGNPCPYTVAWESGNEEVATVDNNGTVTVKKAGTARITVSVVGQTAKKSINLIVEDSTVVKVVDSISIKINGKTAGADDVIVRLGETITLTYEAVVADETKTYSVLWTTANGAVIGIPEENKNAASVTLALNTAGATEITVKVLGEPETAEATVNFVVKKPLVSAIDLGGVDDIVTLNVGESKDFTVTASPADCDEYELEMRYSVEDVVEIVKNGNGYTIVPLKKGDVTVTVAVKGLDDVSALFDVNVAGLISQSEDFSSGTIESGVYYGKNFNMGARADGSTQATLTKSEEGVVWSSWSNGNGRFTLHYNNYDSLNFADGKKYVARVTVKTSASYPDAGYITIFGYRSEANDAYKNPKAEGKDVIATVNGSTARVSLSGKGINAYYDFLLDGSTSSEFFFAYHGDSNTGKSGATVSVTITDVTVFAADEYKYTDVEETFEDATTAGNINKLSYTGVNFDAVSNSGDTMDIKPMLGGELSDRVSGNGLYYVTSRVYKKGLTQTEDDTPSNVTHPKLIFTYKGARAQEGNYKLCIPMFMTANSADLVKTTTAEVYYVNNGGSEKHLVTKTIGWANTLTILEGEIPADDWNGQIVVRFFNSAVTKASQGSKMITYFDGVSLTKLH